MADDVRELNEPENVIDGVDEKLLKDNPDTSLLPTLVASLQPSLWEKPLFQRYKNK